MITSETVNMANRLCQICLDQKNERNTVIKFHFPVIRRKDLKITFILRKFNFGYYLGRI